MGRKTAVKSDNRVFKGKDRESICSTRKSVGLTCANCVYDFTCNPDKKKKREINRAEWLKTKEVPREQPAQATKEPKRYRFTILEKREIMEADRQKITQLAIKYGKPRNYILNLRARWKRQEKTIS